jgi:hypothetical protein
MFSLLLILCNGYAPLLKLIGNVVCFITTTANVLVWISFSSVAYNVKGLWNEYHPGRCFFLEIKYALMLQLKMKPAPCCLDYKPAPCCLDYKPAPYCLDYKPAP